MQPADLSPVLHAQHPSSPPTSLKIRRLGEGSKFGRGDTGAFFKRRGQLRRTWTGPGRRQVQSELGHGVTARDESTTGAPWLTGVGSASQTSAAHVIRRLGWRAMSSSDPYSPV